MIRAAIAGAALLALAGCAVRTLPYTPETQPPGAQVSAAYQVIGDRLRIEIQSEGRRVDDAVIVRPDGSVVRPRAITSDHGMRGGPLGVGVGIGTWRGGLGVDTDLSVGIPFGSGAWPGSTFAYFPLDAAGPPPWLLRVKLAGVAPTDVLVGGAP